MTYAGAVARRVRSRRLGRAVRRTGAAAAQAQTPVRPAGGREGV